MNPPRYGQRDKPSTWSRGRRELASPQGLSLTIALVICFFLTVIAIILEKFLDAPINIVYPAVVVAYVVVITIAMFRISRMNKRAAEARREAYRRKFGREES